MYKATDQKSHQTVPVSCRFYVNSGGGAKIKERIDRAGEKSPAQFLCITRKDSTAEMMEVKHTKASALQDFEFSIVAFHVAICPGRIHRIWCF